MPRLHPPDAMFARSPRLPFLSVFTVLPLGHMPSTPVGTLFSAFAKTHIAHILFGSVFTVFPFVHMPNTPVGTLSSAPVPAEHPCRNRTNVHPDSSRSRRASLAEPIFEALHLYGTERAGLVGCDPSHYGDVKHDAKWLF